MTPTIRVVVVDDHPLFRGGVVRTLQEADDFEVLGEGGSAEEAVALVDQYLPDLVCLDISMPGGGIAAAVEIGRRYPAVRIVMLTVSETEEDVFAALQAGASGYVLKGVGARELMVALRSVAAGSSFVSPDLAARMLVALEPGGAGRPGSSDPFTSLTQREEQILKLVALGQSNKEVARQLELQEKTIKHYMTNILQKLQVRNRVEAALAFRDRGG